MGILNILYQSNNNYAVVTGVSMTSLMENNKELDEINIYILNDDIHEENILKIKEICEKYKRNLYIINTEPILNKLKYELNVTPFRNTYTTYFKLLSVKNLQIKTDRILQLDGDTIITGSLAPLLDYNFENNIMAATYDCIFNSYKELIGIPLTDKYYNCGVILFNHKLWKEEKCEEEIIKHLSNIRNRYFTVDQDILNVLFRKRIKYLDITYNFNSGFYIYGIKESFFIYDLSEEYYENIEKVKDVYKNPLIHHCMGAMTGRPWEKNNIHPQNDLFDKYLKISPWLDYKKKYIKRDKIFKIQKMLYKILPRNIYIHIHKYGIRNYLNNMNKKVQYK